MLLFSQLKFQHLRTRRDENLVLVIGDHPQSNSSRLEHVEIKTVRVENITIHQ